MLLALAFVLRPKLVVLDEPTTALDVATQAHILDTLRRLCKRQGVAAVYVSHDLAVIKDLVDRVVVMYAGRIVEAAPASGCSSGRRTLQPGAAGGDPGCRPAPGAAGHSRPCAGTGAATRWLRLRRALPAPAKRLRAGRAAVAQPRWATAGGCLEPHREPLALVAEAPLAAGALDAQPLLLEVRELNVAYDRQVLFDVSLQLARGECLALVGESGSGKTSLARALAGLGENAQGEVRYAGEPLDLRARNRSKALRHQVQYIFQNPYRALNPRHTVAQSRPRPWSISSACAARPAARASRRCWCGCRCRLRWPICIPTACPVASASAWPSPVRWCASRSC